MNHYSVPVYYSGGITNGDTACDFSGGQFHIREFPFESPDGQLCDTSLIRGKFTILSVSASEDPGTDYVEMQRVLETIHNKMAVQSVMIRMAGSIPERKKYSPGITGQIREVTGSRDRVLHFARCGLIMPGTDSLFSRWVLADPSGRIRGYYNSDRMEDKDRLAVELGILLKEEVHEK